VGLMLAPISVVIPAFNAAAYLHATIRSIRAQTVAVAEIIVVDDGSTDETGAIARANGATLVKQTNAGLPTTRNRGISVASQPWIALADADDLWEPDKIERQWRSLMLAPDAVFSFSDFSQFNERGVINSSVIHEVHSRHFRGVVRTPLGDHASLCDSATLGAAILKQNPFCPSSLIVRKDTALGLGGYDPNLFAGEDYEFVLRLTRDHVGTFVDVPLVQYRRHPTAMTSNIPKMREAMVEVALRIMKRPQEYAPRTSEYFRRRLPLYLLKCGFAHIRYGDQSRARDWLQRSLCERITLSAMALYPLTFLVERGLGRRLRDAAVERSGREAFKSAVGMKSPARSGFRVSS
jgi:glycosyltransferase involved in cell wall biosynthesis